MDGQSYLAFLGFLAVILLPLISGRVFRTNAWYHKLAKPGWKPPDWLFGPIWIVLFGTIAFSGWLIWVEAGGWSSTRPALIAYFVQILLNTLWSPIFFGLRRIGWAAVEMALLWVSIVVTIALFYPIDAGAALLLVPYLVWVSIAFVLNVTIWRLNRQGGEQPA